MPYADNPKLKELRDKARRLPLSPGVYLMKNKRGEIIYIGKALALKNRVSSYFGALTGTPEKVAKMVAQVEDFETILCSSEYEALMLECSLIKQHTPKYNILLKDDKGFHYIRVSPGDWPVISAVHQVEQDGARYLGPYNSSYTVTNTVEEAIRAFRLPNCGKEFPRDIRQSRPCLRFFINQCSAPCAGRINQADYMDSVKEALALIGGSISDTIKSLTARMEQYAEQLEFEKAARLRDRIAAIKRIAQKQRVVEVKTKVMDAVALAVYNGHALFEVFRFQKGRLCDREEFIIPAEGISPTGDDDLKAAMRGEFLTRYYAMKSAIPPHIVLDGAAADQALLEQWLTERAGRRVYMAVPVQGERRQIVDLCRRNAEETLAQKFGRTGRDAASVQELSTLLGLTAPAEIIEAYDISHTAGNETVGGMVVFAGGKPRRSDYRRFKIRTADGGDDYAAMREMLTRRLNEYGQHKGEPAGFGRLPDLVLLDGGRGHVAAILPVFEAADLQLPVFGMVKDDRHKTRAITTADGEIDIKATRAAYTLLTTIQEEVHRFAITYHHARTGRKTLTSALLDIEGIGPERLKALMKQFGSVKRMRTASPEELLAVKGMNRKAAERLIAHFKTHEPAGE